MWKLSFRLCVMKHKWKVDVFVILVATGEVSHRSKFLRSDTYNANMAANRIVVSEMGTMAYPDPSKNFIVK